MRLFLLVAALVVAVTAHRVYAPPKHLLLAARAGRHDSGVIHVHSSAPTALATDEIADAAAGRIEIRRHHRPRGHPHSGTAGVRHGVLCLARSKSTSGGLHRARHAGVAMPRLAGKRGRRPRDVKRLGGFGIVAHPDSPKRSCAGGVDAPFDAVETNLDRLAAACGRNVVASEADLAARLFSC